VDVRIGIIQSMKELEIELDDSADRASLEAEFGTALAAEQIVWLTDRKGRRVGVPAGRVAYIEIGPNSTERRVGFGA
jgi:Protein of unknown function (DUF3107)